MLGRILSRSLSTTHSGKSRRINLRSKVRPRCLSLAAHFTHLSASQGRYLTKSEWSIVDASTWKSTISWHRIGGRASSVAADSRPHDARLYATNGAAEAQTASQRISEAMILHVRLLHQIAVQCTLNLLLQELVVLILRWVASIFFKRSKGGIIPLLGPQFAYSKI